MLDGRVIHFEEVWRRIEERDHATCQIAQIDYSGEHSYIVRVGNYAIAM